MVTKTTRIRTALRAYMNNEAAGGLVLMAAAVAALGVANSPLYDVYSRSLNAYLGPLSVLHWINDGLMSLFFLLVGLEIKREMLSGALNSWGKRLMPGVAALGGMVVPACIYVAFNHASPDAVRGWAIPVATDIAFALGVMSLLGERVPLSLKIFLTALAILDDLAAVVIIALFYTQEINLPFLAGGAALFALVLLLNQRGVRTLSVYLALGVCLWFCIYMSGLHATMAGVLLACAIPLRVRMRDAAPVGEKSPLSTLEHALHKPVALFVVPLFGFANAGVSFGATALSTILVDPVTAGVALGLICGKASGVFGAVILASRMGWGSLPEGTSTRQVLGTALLCGIGFTMSLFIGLLAFHDQDMQESMKMGIVLGSLAAGLAGYAVLRSGARNDRAARV